MSRKPTWKRTSPKQFFAYPIWIRQNLRRTCARLCYAAGGELEQIQFLLGHVSIQTTERYLGCKRRIKRHRQRQDRNRTTGLSERSLSALPTTREVSASPVVG
jgi:hypothetical protein